MREANIEQARELLVGQPKKIRGHEGKPCSGLRCIESHHLGSINPPTFTGADRIWGTTATGWLCGEWDLHAERYTRLAGLFPAPDGGVISEEYPELLS
jgi:hypothetical protein